MAAAARGGGGAVVVDGLPPAAFDVVLRYVYCEELDDQVGKSPGETTPQKKGTRAAARQRAARARPEPGAIATVRAPRSVLRCRLK